MSITVKPFHWGLLIVWLLITTACAETPNQLEPNDNAVPPYTQLQQLHTFTENFVKVEIALEKDAVGNLMLASTYTPTQPDFHLYSKDLPPDGAGRPTRLEILQQDALQAVGQLFADQPIIDQHIEGFAEPFPIYPDGPVTLRLPIQPLKIEQNPIQIPISVTYMTCSSRGRCLPPVVGKEIELTIANDLLLSSESEQ